MHDLVGKLHASGLTHNEINKSCACRFKQKLLHFSRNQILFAYNLILILQNAEVE